MVWRTVDYRDRYSMRFEEWIANGKQCFRNKRHSNNNFVTNLARALL